MENKKKLKVIELRNYLLKPDALGKFIKYFETHFIKSQNILGGCTLGQFRIDKVDDRFFWIRGFEDMNSRSIFLRSFYEEGSVWKEFGPGANDMMINSDNVYLLKPLGLPGEDQNDGIDPAFFDNDCGVAVIDFYIASTRLNELIDLFSSHYQPFLKSLDITASFLVSETSENDFPRLPVFQDKNLLVTITYYKTETEYRRKLKLLESEITPELKSKIPEVVTTQNKIILYRTSS